MHPGIFDFRRFKQFFPAMRRANSEIKPEIDTLCDNLTKCVWETVLALKTLETTL
jgi:hypothetical protein